MKNNDLITIRKQNRYTQKAMAEMLNISYSLYQKMEYGLRKINYSVVEKVSELFPNKESGK